MEYSELLCDETEEDRRPFSSSLVDEETILQLLENVYAQWPTPVVMPLCVICSGVIDKGYSQIICFMVRALCQDSNRLDERIHRSEGILIL